eukprot:SM000049S16699  [mRNA]  locus=s49:142580:145069:- [translate_table: standard]
MRAICIVLDLTLCLVPLDNFPCSSKMMQSTSSAGRLSSLASEASLPASAPAQTGTCQVTQPASKAICLTCQHCNVDTDPQACKRAVTVCCGSCMGLFSVTITPDRATYDTLHPSAAISYQQQQQQQAGDTCGSPHTHVDLCYVKAASLSNSGFLACQKKLRPPSPYNLYIRFSAKVLIGMWSCYDLRIDRDEMLRVKSINPLLDHREAFKIAAKNWATAPENIRRNGRLGLDLPGLTADWRWQSDSLYSAESQSESATW